jgi:hypothetical protein
MEVAIMKFAKAIIIGSFLGGEMFSTGLPTLISSGEEGPHLKKYHQSILKSAESWDVSYTLMPKSRSELDALYDWYKSGKMIVKWDFLKPEEYLWSWINDGIALEFQMRCKDGIKHIIDEYLVHFKSFVEVTDNFHDQSFLNILYHSPLYCLEVRLHSGFRVLESEVKKGKLTRESTYLPYTIAKIDEIFKASKNFKNAWLAEWYKRFYLTDEGINSPEYQAMWDAVAATFEEGVSVVDLLSDK